MQTSRIRIFPSVIGPGGCDWDAGCAHALAASQSAKLLVVDPGVEQYVKASDTRYRMRPYHFLMHGSEVDWSRFEWIEGRFGDAHVARVLGKAFCTVK